MRWFRGVTKWSVEIKNVGKGRASKIEANPTSQGLGSYKSDCILDVALK